MTPSPSAAFSCIHTQAHTDTDSSFEHVLYSSPAGAFTEYHYACTDRVRLASWRCGTTFSP